MPPAAALQLQPLEKAGYRTLMLLQADLGDRAGAVSTSVAVRVGPGT